MTFHGITYIAVGVLMHIGLVVLIKNNRWLKNKLKILDRKLLLLYVPLHVEAVLFHAD